MAQHEGVMLRIGLHRVRRLGVELKTAPIVHKVLPPKPIKLARMLAMAHVLAARIEARDIEDCQTAAELCQLSKARIAQLLDLTLLAPDIQAQILEMTQDKGDDPIHERDLRAIIRDSSGEWRAQRAGWEALLRAKRLR